MPMNNDEIRTFIDIASMMLIERELTPLDVIITEEVSLPLDNHSEFEEAINDLLFKLKAYQDPDIGEYSAGVEAGMSRAAEMIENMMNRLRGN